jgi:TPP-dependent pyruvate/acetoin dehydrogenase alpha subunit
MEFASTGKGAFACRKSVKVDSNVKLTMVGDGSNVEGDFTWM